MTVTIIAGGSREGVSGGLSSVGLLRFTHGATAPNRQLGWWPASKMTPLGPDSPTLCDILFCLLTTLHFLSSFGEYAGLGSYRLSRAIATVGPVFRVQSMRE